MVIPTQDAVPSEGGSGAEPTDPQVPGSAAPFAERRQRRSDRQLVQWLHRRFERVLKEGRSVLSSDLTRRIAFGRSLSSLHKICPEQSRLDPRLPQAGAQPSTSRLSKPSTAARNSRGSFHLIVDGRLPLHEGGLCSPTSRRDDRPTSSTADRHDPLVVTDIHQSERLIVGQSRRRQPSLSTLA